MMKELIGAGTNLFCAIHCVAGSDEGENISFFYPSISLSLLDDSHSTNYTRLLEISDTEGKSEHSITFTLSNGQTFTTNQNTDIYNNGSYVEISFSTSKLICSDKKTLIADDINARYRYAMEQFQKYDIRRITVDGIAFDLSDFHSAATLRAMMKTIAEKTSCNVYVFNINDTPSSLSTTSIVDFVRHPFALSSLSGTTTYEATKAVINLPSVQTKFLYEYRNEQVHLTVSEDDEKRWAIYLWASN